MITVGIVDDEALVRGGIRGVLEHVTDIQVIGEAGNGATAVELVRAHRPNVLVMDIRMPGVDGLSATEHIRRLAPATAVVLLTAMATENQIHRGLRAGAAGFLLKEGDPRDLVTAIRAVAAGEAVLSPAVTRRVLDRVVEIDLEPLDRARALVGTLTSREREVLGLVAAGLGNLQIARRLYLSEGAIKAHVSRLLAKLSCDNRVQAAIVAHDARLAVSPGAEVVPGPFRNVRPRSQTDLVANPL
ncbi:DNA-binding NarL/FixJ family response regulator [Kibdelosporangium banguiense]|uniref:DNA-binding NarL/FixJ family response regulator n=1 Tax=Kibdelosporangium banguiense TaxID=1365924 RepID=A0ABS4TQJ0_9PSEU|nr:response regulator transcription factor [Kibdelosporangium banguiense]MBP2326672.1 DNA-binding NarL/FixJ family response regulator [Kibdelosporangium banguiense]